MGKTCIACSMPMNEAKDFAKGDMTKDYCCYCAREDGSMKSYSEVLEGSIPWAMENFAMMGFSSKPTVDEARKAIAGHMNTLPAWQNKGNCSCDC